MSYCLDLPHGSDILGQWLYDWQTLIAGVLALSAAVWAGKLLRQQIRQTEDFRRDEIAHRHNAARTVFPLTLSAIDELCREISEQIAHEIEVRLDFDAALSEASKQSAGRNRFEAISLSEGVIANVKGFVETIRNIKNIRHISELMSGIQILISRYNEFDLSRNTVIVKIGLFELLIDVAKIGLLNDSIYNYSRFVDDENFSIVGEVSNADAWNMIHKKAEGLIFSRRIPDYYFGPIKGMIDRRKEGNNSPWIEKFEG